MNQQRAARGAPPLDVLSLVAATWAVRTADELLAYVIDQNVDIAVQLATGTGRARVALIVSLEPLRFFRSYAGLHWLDDVRDREALRFPAAEPILQRAGNSDEMRAVYNAIQRWVAPPGP